MDMINSVWNYISTNSILSGAIATLLAALAIFIFKEYIKGPPDLSGSFHIECKTLFSKYNPYINMVSIYTLNIISNGNDIEGYIEKTNDINSDLKFLSYEGKHRTRGEVSGVIKRNYLRRNQVSLHIKMTGVEREYSILIVFKK